MGLMKKLAAEDMANRRKSNRARRAASKGKKNKIELVVEPSNKHLDKLWKEIPNLVRQKTFRPAVRAASKYVVKELKQALRAHKSSVTGTELLQSWAVFNKRQQRQYDLQESIAYKLKTYKRKPYMIHGIIGPRRPDGNHAALLERGGYRKLWGGKAIQVQPTYIFEKTATRTKRNQQAIMLREVRKRRFDA